MAREKIEDTLVQCSWELGGLNQTNQFAWCVPRDVHHLQTPLVRAGTATTPKDNMGHFVLHLAMLRAPNQPHFIQLLPPAKWTTEPGCCNSLREMLVVLIQYLSLVDAMPFIVLLCCSWPEPTGSHVQLQLPCSFFFFEKQL